jgi:hypothetical protein
MIGRYDGVCRFAKLKDEGGRGFDPTDGSPSAVAWNELDGFEDIHNAGAVIDG